MRRWFVIVTAVAVAGCRDDVSAPHLAPEPVRYVAQAVVCVAAPHGVRCRSAAPTIAPTASLAAASAVASARELTVREDAPDLPAIVFGGNGSRFDLEFFITSSGTLANDGFEYVTRLRNSLGQPIGTVDGVSPHPDGIRLGLINDPVALAGTGVITPVRTRGTAAFGVPDRPYWQISSGVLRAGASVQGEDVIGFEVPSTVQRFEFRLLLSAALTDESESGLRPRQAGFDNFAIGPFGGCGTRPDGLLWCWGRNDEGLMANGTYAGSLVRTGTVSNGTSLAMGTDHLCTSNTGTFNLSCTGSNGAGQLGIGFPGGYVPFFSSAAPQVFVRSLSGGGENTCGFTTTAPQLVCWGDNRFGQLARDPAFLTASGTPLVVTPPTGVTFREVIVGRTGTICALSTDDRAFCWGRNDAGQLGTGVVAGPPNATPAEVAGGRTWRQLAIGDRFACGNALADGATWCWGDGSASQLGGAVPSSLVPVLVANVPAASGLTAGAAFACALTTDGDVSCWGRNERGQLGRGTVGGAGAPALVSLAGAPFAQVVAGARHACARPSGGGTLECWGDNRQGQLATDRSTGEAPTPVSAGTVTGTDVLIGGHETTCVGTPIVPGQFSFECFGSGAGMQLGGTGVAGTQVEPVGTLSAARWFTIGVGDGHACALNERGVPYCWGRGHAGQLGTGVAASSALPQAVAVGLDSVFTQLSVGFDHACAIRASDAVLLCWGQNTFGQLGLGTRTNALEPAPVTGGRSYARVVAGPRHTCARTTGGDLQCWGANAAGQVGNGSTVDVTAPVTIATGIGPEFALGGNGEPESGFTCAFFNGMSCWGRGSDGQLGTNAPNASTSPVQATAVVAIPGSTLLQIAAGRAHACVLVGTDFGRAVWCWGAGAEGQVQSFGSNDRYLAPVQVSDGLSPSRVTAAANRTCFEDRQRWFCFGGRNMLGESGTGSVGPQSGSSVVP